MRRPLLGKVIGEHLIAKYWRDVNNAGLLEMRLCDVDNPTEEDGRALHLDKWKRVFYVFDQERMKIVGEYTLHNFTGLSAQIHFSVHPDNTIRENVKFCTEESDRVLNEFQHPNGGPYLNSLYGLTPVTNHAACKFILKCGFEDRGILPYGIKDRGKVVDAMLTIKLHGERSWAEKPDEVQ